MGKKETLDINVESLINLEEGEKVVLEVRRHSFILYNRIAFLLVLFFLPLIVAPGLGTLIDKASGAEYGSILIGFLFLIWCLALWVSFFLYWTDYYLDVWVITNKRIFDIEQKGLFNREVSVTRMEQVQDVTMSIDGIFATLLRFGNIHIHTASSEIDFTIKNAAEPLQVKETIMKVHGELLEVWNDLPPQQRPHTN